MATVLDQLESAQNLLKSTKVTKRKEGLKQLLILLDSDSVNAELHSQAIRSSAGGAVPDASWPGLCSALIALHKASGSRLAASDGLSQAKALRRTVQLAEDSRSGTTLPLLQVAAKLFQHISDLLRSHDLSSPVGLEHGSLLRLLLSVPDYCARAYAKSFEDLIDIHITALLGFNLGHAEEHYRSATSLHLLLQNFPADLSAESADYVLHTFADIFSRLHESREEGRISLSVLSCLNVFLQNHGLDMCRPCLELHEKLQPFIMRIFGCGRDARLQEAVVCYLRLQMRLQALDGHLSHMRDLMDKELGKAGFHWGDGDRTVINAQQHALLDLMASIWFHLSADEHAAPGQADEPAAKRRKVDSALEPSAAEDAGDSGPDPTVLWASWKVIWDALVSWLSIEGGKSANLHEEALTALAIIASRQCLGPHIRPQVQELLDMPPFHGPLTSSALLLIRALFATYGTAGQDELKLRQQLLDRFIPMEVFSEAGTG
ncbi:hypothetical protein WJX73_007060 [Symbiochloris irregularis]|uniref:Telomere-length maintenance and DNA damage repair domain-containing protein n=1 Tax=Symbiochloris irregularis TaxID=706552 RepID=A0AAW1Q2Q4_9CHLO